MIRIRLLMAGVTAALAVRAVLVWLTGRESRADMVERLRGPRVNGPVLWLHGASVGELAPARRVVEQLLADDPERTVLVTSNTIAGRAQVAGWEFERVTTALAPLPDRQSTHRLIRTNDARALIVMENELWPGRIDAARDAGLPVILLNARMSAGTARGWARLRGAAANLLNRIALIAPQDSASAERFVALGGDPNRIAPPLNLKALYRADVDAPTTAMPRFDRATTVLAAATHAGEDEIVLDAFAQMLRHDPRRRLILAPRHPDRAVAIRALAEARNLPVAQRSLNETADRPVYLADTLGEMALWYRAAGAAFVGGSLVPKGGHTPFEPVALGCPVIHGPNVANFAESYAALHAAEAAVEISNADELATAWSMHLHDDNMSERARQALPEPSIDALMQRLNAALTA